MDKRLFLYIKSADQYFILSKLAKLFNFNVTLRSEKTVSSPIIHLTLINDDKTDQLYSSFIYLF
jgi:hypothetical protein